MLTQGYVAGGRLADDLPAAGLGGTLSDEKAELAIHFALDVLAPTNFLLTNPAALKRAFETGGMSVLAGARNFLDDLVNNGGRPRPVDITPLQLRRNPAATPGRVLFRNELISINQHSPQSQPVPALPLR